MLSKKPINTGNILEYLRVRLPNVVNKVVMGENVPLELLSVAYTNEDSAIQLLKDSQGKPCIIHCDVDTDGISAGNIFYKSFIFEGYFSSMGLVINPERKHGVELSTSKNGELELVGYGEVEGLRGSLLVVVDSSSNLIDEIRKLPCDVLVLDHHEIDCELSELVGDTAGGRYVVVNSMAMDYLDKELEDFNGGVYQTSGAQVVFEILVKSKILPDIMKSAVRHWVAVSLFSDVVDTSGEQAQRYIADWYIRGNEEFKGTIGQFPYTHLNKSFINLKLSPTINGAIRAGLSDKAVEAGIRYPNRLAKLKEEIEPIKVRMRGILLPLREYGGVIIAKTCNSGLPNAYKGMRAGSIAGEYGKPAFVYHRYTYEDVDYITGSFRGVGDINYLQYFKGLGFYAKGHGGAFGLTIPVSEAHSAFKGLPKVVNQDNISIGERLSSPELLKGYYVLCGELGKVYRHIEGIYKDCIIIHEGSLNSGILELVGKVNNRLTHEISFKILGEPKIIRVYERYAKWDIGGFEMRTFGDSCGRISSGQALLITYEGGYPKLTA
jgi:single-stranded DNA-specific DHH superfamily exonuclease